MYCDWPELGRCCFCLPLRRGVVLFGYASILFSAFMIGLYSYIIHYNVGNGDRIDRPFGDGRLFNFPSELCITMYCTEVIFDALLIYGSHKKVLTLIKAYYYFALTTAIAVVAVQILVLTMMEKFYFGLVIEVMIFTFAGLCIQIYLITLVRSLMKKLEISGPHVYDNQLHQIVTGEFKVETNGSVYNNTTTPADI